MTLNPTSVVGGTQSSAGTVTLSGPAPAGGAQVALSSSNGAASVPSSVTLPTGTSSATFPVNTSAVTSSTPVTISASYGGVTQTASLTVTAAPNYTLSASPTSLSITQGSGGTATVAVTPLNGFSGSVSLSASGLPSGVTASFGPNPATTTSTMTLAASSTATTGAVTVTIRGTSGSLTNTTTITLTVTADSDTTPPDTTITSAPPARSNSSSASFSFTATEAGSTFACQLDGSAFAPCGSPQSYSALAEGSHTFQVRATDPAGNTDPTPASYIWTADTTPPDTTITSAPPARSNSSSASFSFTATEAGSTFACQLDGSAFAACGSPQSYSALADGSHTFEVRATDPAGNTDPTPASYIWTADTTPPDTTITSAPPARSNSSSASFSFTATEAGSTFACQLDGSAFAPCGSPQSYSALAGGSHTFEVRATDPAGNTDPTPASYTWTVDAAAPDTTITSAPPARSNSSSASFSFTATKPGSTFACRLDGSAFAACGSPQSYSALADGSHTFQVRATDPAGNTDPTPASYTWTVDTAPPHTTITSAPPALSLSSSASFSSTATEAGSTFACRLDGSAFAPCGSPQSYGGLTIGSHTFEVRATDPAGNTDPTPASYTWIVVSILPGHWPF